MFIGKQVGVEPWRFLFFSEALPCFLVGVLVLLLLPDEPTSCGSFLDADGHRWLCERSARMQEEKRKLNPNGAGASSMTTAASLRRIMRDARVLIASISGFFWSCGQVSIFFEPTAPLP